jgi:trk system potassium uptake protein TrkH
MSSNSRVKAFFKMSPAKYILLSFALLIFIGAFLLCLPISNVNGEWRSFIDALFSSTTSVCVTGLMTIDIATELTLFGEFIVLLLIQIGGLGFVTSASLVYMMIGKKINYQTRMTLQESLNADDNAGVIKMVRSIFLTTAICELAGFLMLLPSMIKFSGSFWSGSFKALFLAISAFCNAGIDPLGPVTADFSNIACFATNASVLIPIMLLIVLGGIGFIVFVEIFSRTQKSKKFTLHTRVVLTVTAVLILGGAGVFMLAEWNNPKTIGSFSTFDKIVNCFFQSVTTRTAGFASFGQGDMTQISKLLSGLLMFIGGSPMSIAGGIKITTFFLLLLILFKNQDQNGNIIYREKKITAKILSKAVRIALMAVSLLFIGTVLIYIFEGGNMPVASIVYDVISAICTVGLSFGITPALCGVSKFTLVLLMYVGRVGMLTIPLAFKSKDANSAIEYVNAKITVG